MTEEVSSFVSDFKLAHLVPMVDDNIICDYEWTRDICTLVYRDTLSTPAIGHNLTPPFMMRESGTNVSTVLNFQVQDFLFMIIQCAFPTIMLEHD